MAYNSKYTGEQVEQLLDQVASGNAGSGGGGITVETDPIFSASPAATITEEKIAEWDAKSAQGEKGDKGDKGDDGATFTPSVDANGNLSWTNNKGLANPPTVNIKGQKGDAGENGVSEEYVNNAIANAITNAINASY